MAIEALTEFLREQRVVRALLGRDSQSGDLFVSREISEAERIAATAACTDLTSGMTALMQCEQSAPRQVTWKD